MSKMAEKESEKQPKSDNKKAKPAKPKKEVDNSTLPLLVELTFTSAVILLSLVFFLVVGILLFSGATVFDFILRAGTSTLVIGILLLVIVRQVSMGALSSGLGTKDKLPQLDKLDENEIKSPFKVN
jgi:hypothetical protein